MLGFANQWYELGLETAVERRLESGATIRAVRPRVVVATKLAAWRGRGQGDILRSYDVHDILLLVNGRPELADELAAQAAELKNYVAVELTMPVADRYVEYAIQDAVRGNGPLAAERATIVMQRLDEIISRLALART